MDLMPLDELNRLEASLPVYFENGRIKSRKDLDEILDMLEALFLLAYANGAEAVNLSLSSDIAPVLDDVMKTVDAKIGGKTWRERVEEYYRNGGDAADIVRIAETECHRDANAAAYDTAVKAGAKEKTWRTMRDDKVRDSHYWLDGVTVPIDAEFYNDMGDKTMYPGQWGVPEEDVNCRCWVTFR